jgi:hypothetical protein
MSRHKGFCRGKIPLFFLCIFLGPVCQAQESRPDSAISKSPAADAKRPNLADLSLEELMAVEIKVSTVSRQSESLSQARLPFLWSPRRTFVAAPSPRYRRHCASSPGCTWLPSIGTGGR